MKKKISFVFPTRKRPKKAIKTIENLLGKSKTPENIEVIFVFDSDDQDSANEILESQGLVAQRAADGTVELIRRARSFAEKITGRSLDVKQVTNEDGTISTVSKGLTPEERQKVNAAEEKQRLAANKDAAVRNQEVGNQVQANLGQQSLLDRARARIARIRGFFGPTRGGVAQQNRENEEGTRVGFDTELSRRVTTLASEDASSEQIQNQIKKSSDLKFTLKKRVKKTLMSKSK